MSNSGKRWIHHQRKIIHTVRKGHTKLACQRERTMKASHNLLDSFKRSDLVETVARRMLLLFMGSLWNLIKFPNLHICKQASSAYTEKQRHKRKLFRWTRATILINLDINTKPLIYSTLSGLCVRAHCCNACNCHLALFSHCHNLNKANKTKKCYMRH